jgi:hypothetical protein
MSKIVESETRPSKNAMHQGGKTWIVDDDDELDPSAKELTGTKRRDAMPQRFDLPEDHPHYGKRFARRRISGQGDLEVLENGDIKEGDGDSQGEDEQ